MDGFSTEQQAVLSLLCSSLWGHSPCPDFPPETDWTAIYRELLYQTVEGLVIESLIHADPTHKTIYFQQTTRKLSFFFSLMGVQQELCNLLQENGIPCVVLKGSAAAIYYPQPVYRSMGDIDLIVSPKDYEKAHQVLLAHGCQRLPSDSYRHSEWRHQGILIELHRYFSVFKNDSLSRQLDHLIYHGIGCAETVSLEGFTFPMLPRLGNGIVLLEHISHHMEHGLGLRQIIDWMFYAEQNLDDSRWETEFRPAAQAIGLETLAITTTRMCQLFLGLREDLTWCRQAEEDLCYELMAYIFDQGNFGQKKDASHNQTMVVLNTARNIPDLFRRLQYHGCHNWKAVHRHPWLKPFAWIYQSGRYVRLGLQRETPFRNLWEDAKASRQQDVFLDRLGVIRHGQGIATPEVLKTENKNS